MFRAIGRDDLAEDVDFADPRARLARALEVDAVVAPRFSDAAGRVEHLGPRLGQHNHEVYAGLLGLDAAEVDRLRQEGVL